MKKINEQSTRQILTSQEKIALHKIEGMFTNRIVKTAVDALRSFRDTEQAKAIANKVDFFPEGNRQHVDEVSALVWDVALKIYHQYASNTDFDTAEYARTLYGVLRIVSEDGVWASTAGHPLAKGHMLGEKTVSQALDDFTRGYLVDGDVLMLLNDAGWLAMRASKSLEHLDDEAKRDVIHAIIKDVFGQMAQSVYNAKNLLWRTDAFEHEHGYQKRAPKAPF